jgi:hypothetical protein
MMHKTLFRWTTTLGAILLAVPLLAVADAGSSAAKPHSDADLIRIAVSAAPAAVGKHATVVAMEADGTMRTLRKGTNGFTCMAGNLELPGPDAMCTDGAAMAWMHAYMEKKAPPTRVGLAYMLAGGTDTSNTDPFAPAPAKGGKWVRTGPHVMILGADKAFYEQYPKGADPDTSVPYVMWAGTPYEHLMAPTR